MKFGIIHDVNLNNQTFSLREKKGLRYFFVPKGIFKKLKKYLYAGNYVSFTTNDTTIIKNNKEIESVKAFKEISVPSNARRTKLYSKKDNSKELSKFLDDINNLMFIDIEMTMSDYDERYHRPELIQASYLITSNDFKILEKRDFHIMPSSSLNKRTCDFLHLNKEEFESLAVEYLSFYTVFKSDIAKYSPTLVIFGKNDKRYLELSYNANMVESLNSRLRFVNLSQLLKNYYDLSNDPGLFKTYASLYNEELQEQKHDAYEDAYYTMKVYERFKEIVNEKK